MKIRSLLVLGGFCVAAISLTNLASAQTYTMYALETPSGTLGNQAFALNNSGVAVGSSNMTSGSDQAIKWSGSTTPTITTLAPLATGSLSRAFDINDSGVVCGFSRNSSSRNQAVTWSSGGTITNITPSGAYDGRSQRINNLGQVLGFATDGSTGADYFLFKYDGSTSTSLTPGTYPADDPIAFNEAGQVLAGNYNSAVDLYLYTNGTRSTFFSGGSWTNPIALAINQVGQVLYTKRSNYGAPEELKLWTPSARNGTSGTTQDITIPGVTMGTGQWSASMNAYGDIVAMATPSGGGTAHAYVRLHSSSSAASWQDLNGLVTNLSGWTLVYAPAINEKGQILCWGQKVISGSTRQISFRLDPGFTIDR